MEGRPGAALFRLVRYWSRRWILQASEELTGSLDHFAVRVVLTAEEADCPAAAPDPNSNVVINTTPHAGCNR